MPHTRAARLKTAKEASDLRDVVQLHNTSTNAGWNDYFNWDLPGLTYEPDALAWYPNAAVDTSHEPIFTQAQSPTTVAGTTSLDARYEQASNTDFCGLQPWYSTTTTGLSSISPDGTTRAQPSTSALSSYDSTPFDKDARQARRKYNNQQPSPQISRRESSPDDGNHRRRASDTQPPILVKDASEHPSPSSEDEIERTNAARSDAYKKRKIAHSVIEKNYRCRIKEGMAELRRCVPAKEKGGRRSLDSTGNTQAGETASNQPSGKVAILSDAVQYVKALEQQNKSLHGQLDVMQRRNNTLQKIALSKVDPTASPREIDEGDEEQQLEGEDSELASKRRRKFGVHERDDGRFTAGADPPMLTRRYGVVTGTLAGIKISGH